MSEEMKTLLIDGDEYEIVDASSRVRLTAHDTLFNNSPYYEEVISYKERNYNTDCYFSIIPTHDAQGNIINFYVDYVADKNPLEQAHENHTTVTVNGNATLDTGGEYYVAGITISNGTVINSRSFYGYENPNPMYIGIKADRSHVDYQMNTNITTSQMLADGCMNVFNCYFKLVENGAVTDLTNRYWNEYTLTEDDEDVLMLIGFKANDDIVLMACDGRTNINDGLTAREAGNLMISKGCVDVYYLDGGGSTCLVVNGSKLNRNIDGGGTIVRSAHYTLNAKKDLGNFAVEDAFSNAGLEKQRLIEQIVPYINSVAKWEYHESLDDFIDSLKANGNAFVILSDSCVSEMTNTFLTASAQGIAMKNGGWIDYVVKVGAYSGLLIGRIDRSTKSALWDTINSEYNYIEIPSNTNLNDVTANGYYSCPDSTRAATLSNCPTSGGFTLEVKRNATTYKRQMIYDNFGDAYMRIRTSGGTWSSWKAIAMAE